MVHSTNASSNFTIVLQVLAFLLGVALQSLQVTFVVFGVVSALLFVVRSGTTVPIAAPSKTVDKVVLPPWPMFNRHPVKWLPAKEATTSS